ncbi:hypothetical protein ACTFIY_005908 [Dictyostelium cf. discoideum]
MLKRTIVKTEEIRHSIKALIGFKVKNGDHIHSLFLKGSHTKPSNMKRIKEGLYFSLLENQKESTIHGLFTKEFCDFHKIDLKKFEDLSKKLSFGLHELEDGNFWFNQHHYDIFGEYDVIEKPFNKGDHPNPNCNEHTNLSYENDNSYNALVNKYKLLQKFSDEHNLGLTFKEEDIPNNLIYYPEHILKTQVIDEDAQKN